MCNDFRMIEEMSCQKYHEHKARPPFTDDQQSQQPHEIENARQIPRIQRRDSGLVRALDRMWPGVRCAPYESV
ncbi:unnamed protein product [Toxocara canis]|uniref:DUF159 family protein n=1 Tax=Toxocara canis TaxID=6265 RepID=A0A183UDZ2_TOXCA|nr:unnamed protein product [Toxocara canis]